MSALTDVFTAIANAIRSKKGVSTTYKPSEMASAISSISTGTDTSDATLDSGSRMLSGYTAYAKGTKYSGSITQRSASTETISSSRTYDSGYYPGQWTVTPNTGPKIAVGSFTPSTSMSKEYDVGFKPKKLFIYYQYNANYGHVIAYDEDISTTMQQQGYKIANTSEGYGSWMNLSTDGKYNIISITSNGFKLNYVSSYINGTHYYVAIG